MLFYYIKTEVVVRKLYRETDSINVQSIKKLVTRIKAKDKGTLLILL